MILHVYILPSSSYDCKINGDAGRKVKPLEDVVFSAKTKLAFLILL